MAHGHPRDCAVSSAPAMAPSGRPNPPRQPQAPPLRTGWPSALRDQRLLAFRNTLPRRLRLRVLDPRNFAGPCAHNEGTAWAGPRAHSRPARGGPEVSCRGRSMSLWGGQLLKKQGEGAELRPRIVPDLLLWVERVASLLRRGVVASVSLRPSPAPAPARANPRAHAHAHTPPARTPTRGPPAQCRVVGKRGCRMRSGRRRVVSTCRCPGAAVGRGVASAPSSARCRCWAPEGRRRAPFGATTAEEAGAMRTTGAGWPPGAEGLPKKLGPTTGPKGGPMAPGGDPHGFGDPWAATIPWSPFTHWAGPSGIRVKLDASRVRWPVCAGPNPQKQAMDGRGQAKGHQYKLRLRARLSRSCARRPCSRACASKTAGCRAASCRTSSVYM